MINKNWFWKRKPKAIRKIEKNLGMKLSDLGDTIYPNKDIQNTCDKIISTHKMNPNTNLAIATEDLMFLFVLHNNALDITYKAYLLTGWNGRNIINKLVINKYEKWANITNILDFASGFGRVSRHLLNDTKKENIWVSDIKKESIDWQKKHFGFQTVISENKVEHFNPSVKFDVVFVGSLFTHLPEMLFKEWLEKLMNLLTTNGTLIISTFDINVHGKEYDSSFKYLEMSEDRLFNSLNSSIKGENKYGITYTTPKYIYDQLHQLNVKEDQIERYPLAFGKIQDIYIIHNQKVKLSPIDFSSYP